MSAACASSYEFYEDTIRGTDAGATAQINERWGTKAKDAGGPYAGGISEDCVISQAALMMTAAFSAIAYATDWGWVDM